MFHSIKDDVREKICSYEKHTPKQQFESGWRLVDKRQNFNALAFLNPENQPGECTWRVTGDGGTSFIALESRFDPWNKTKQQNHQTTTNKT